MFSINKQIVGIPNFDLYPSIIYVYMLTKYKSYVGLVSGELVRSKRKHITYHIRLDVAYVNMYKTYVYTSMSYTSIT